jgi:hypothetical protein
MPYQSVSVSFHPAVVSLKSLATPILPIYEIGS